MSSPAISIGHSSSCQLEYLSTEGQPTRRSPSPRPSSPSLSRNSSTTLPEEDIADTPLCHGADVPERILDVPIPGQNIVPPPKSSQPPAPQPNGHPARIIAMPVSPEDVITWRYEREPFRPGCVAKITTIEPMVMTYLRRDVPPEWEACEHPEGKLYFRHPGKRILTHTDISDPENLKDIEALYQSVESKLEDFNPRRPSDLEMVLDIRRGKKTIFGYYLASWEARAVTWAEETDIWLATLGERDVYCQAHLRHAVERQFWYGSSYDEVSRSSTLGCCRSHIEMFPNHRNIPAHLIDELKDTLLFGWNDLMTSDTSTVPYDERKLSELSRVMEKVKEGRMNGYRAIVIARNMGTFCKERFLNYHGQPGARLNRDECMSEATVHRERSLTFLLLSPCLFWMPDIYLAELEKIWVDNTVNYRPWNRFITELKRDWKASTTPATVLLSANVGFLAIQSLDISDPNKSVNQITSYVSTLLSLATYIICQILTRQHRGVSDRDDASRAASYLARKSSSYFGMEAVAFAVSLPIALFIWSMLTFLLAVSYVCFFQTSTATRIVTGVCFSFLAVITGLVLYMDWGTNPSVQPDIRGSTLRTLRRRLPIVFGWMGKRKVSGLRRKMTLGSQSAV
ncbi:unnamed protein product [Somion occarium]|uniref:WW domain-containing protein n=1 Tax=Somion occarium TaxID=3059160 RepID=A0ABP1CV36_9APHY